MSEAKTIHIIKWVGDKIVTTTYEEYGFDVDALDKAKKQTEKIEASIMQLETEIQATKEELRRESLEMDESPALV